RDYTESLNHAGETQMAIQARKEALLCRSDVLRRLGRKAESQADFQNVVDTFYTNANDCNLEAWDMVVGPIGKRDPERAGVLAEKAVRLERTGALLNTLGVAYYRNGQFSNAISTLLEAARANRGTASFYPEELDYLPIALSLHKLDQGAAARYYRWRAVLSDKGESSGLGPADFAALKSLQDEANSLLGPVAAGPAETLIEAASTLRKSGQVADAEAACRKAILLQRQASNQWACVISLGKLAELLVLQKKWSEASDSYREQLSLLAALLGKDADEVSETLTSLSQTQQQ